MRIIKTVTSNPASLLDSAFFDNLPELDRQHYVGSVVRRIMGTDFLTNAGIRSRSLAGAHLVSFWDYHGSYVSWPKDTSAVARGLRRQGFPRLSRQLENRLVNLLRRTRDYPEFVYVDGWGRVLPGIPKSIPRRATVTIQGSNAPERIQAWTVSAIMAIMARRSPLRTRRGSPLQDAWQQQLEGQVLETIPKMNAYLNPFRLWLQYPTHTYHLDRPQAA
jgi:glycogen debranching enzyme